MPQPGREELFFMILVFFAIITGITGIINLTNSGIIELGDMGSGDFMQTLPGQNVPNLQTSSTFGGAGATYGNQDFTTASGFESNITKVSGNWIGGDHWARYDGIGYMTNYVPNLYPYLAEIQFTGVTPDANNIYDVTYHVSNSFGSEPFYSLIQGSETGGNFISGFYIKYDTDSISIVNSNAVESPIYSVSYYGANTASTVETVYDATSGSVNVYVDGTFAATFSNVAYSGVTLNGGQAKSNSGVYYAGIGATHYGFQVSEVNANFTIYDEITPWSFALSQLNGLVVVATQFLTLIGATMGLTSNALIPFWLWAIIGIPCLATLILIYIEISRGV